MFPAERASKQETRRQTLQQRRITRAGNVARLRQAIGILLTELQARSGLSAAEIAARARTTPKEVKRLLAGKLGPVETFAAIGRALGYDSGHLLNLAEIAAGVHKEEASRKLDAPLPATREELRAEVFRLLQAGRQYGPPSSVAAHFVSAPSKDP
jgi:hypothetical protein